jgi:hypothetical protein
VKKKITERSFHCLPKGAAKMRHPLAVQVRNYTPNLPGNAERPKFFDTSHPLEKPLSALIQNISEKSLSHSLKIFYLLAI